MNWFSSLFTSSAKKPNYYWGETKPYIQALFNAVVHADSYCIGFYKQYPTLAQEDLLFIQWQMAALISDQQQSDLHIHLIPKLKEQIEYRSNAYFFIKLEENYRAIYAKEIVQQDLAAVNWTIQKLMASSTSYIKILETIITEIWKLENKARQMEIFNIRCQEYKEACDFANNLTKTAIEVRLEKLEVDDTHIEAVNNSMIEKDRLGLMLINSSQFS